MKRLELTAVRICQRCRRGRANLVASDGVLLAIPLDPARARELAATGAAPAVRPLGDLVLAGLAAAGLEVREIVLDVDDGVLRALLTYARGEDLEVAACTPQEGVALAVRGGLRLYATDEALAHAAVRVAAGGSETVH